MAGTEAVREERSEYSELASRPRGPRDSGAVKMHIQKTNRSKTGVSLPFENAKETPRKWTRVHLESNKFPSPPAIEIPILVFN